MPRRPNGHTEDVSSNIARFAEPIDEGEIRRLLLLGHTENGIFPFDAHKSHWVINRLLYTPWIPAADQGLRGCFGVIGPKGGRLEAMTMLILAQHWYSYEQFLEELIVYVDPEHRHARHALTLIEWMKHQADRLGVPLITGVVSQKRTEAKCRLYQRKLTKVGEFFIHTPPGYRWKSDIIMNSSVISSSAA